MSDVTRDEMRLAIEGSEARAETKAARLDGKIDLVIEKIDRLNGRMDELRDDNRATRSNIWVVGFGLAALIVAIFLGLPAVFSLGTQLRDMVAKEVQTLAPQGRL